MKEVERLNKILNVYMNRSAWFASIALNTLPDQLNNSHIEFPYKETRFTSQSPNFNQVKETYKEWILWNTLREIYQGYEQILDKTLNTLKDHPNLKEISKKKDKIKPAYSILALPDEYFEIISSIVLARNSITHNMGLAEKKKKEPKLNVRWYKIGYEKVTNNDKTQLDVSLDVREESFDHGKKLGFDYEDIGQIIFTVWFISTQIIKNLKKHFSSGSSK